MDLRLGKNAIFFKDTFCLIKSKCTYGHNIHDTLVLDMKNPTRIDSCCNLNVVDLNQNTVVH